LCLLSRVFHRLSDCFTLFLFKLLGKYFI
jgi:hypothetical protein